MHRMASVYIRLVHMGYESFTCNCNVTLTHSYAQDGQRLHLLPRLAVTLRSHLSFIMTHLYCNAPCSVSCIPRQVLRVMSPRALSHVCHSNNCSVCLTHMTTHMQNTRYLSCASLTSPHTCKVVGIYFFSSLTNIGAF